MTCTGSKPSFSTTTASTVISPFHTNEHRLLRTSSRLRASSARFSSSVEYTVATTARSLPGAGRRTRPKPLNSLAGTSGGRRDDSHAGVWHIHAFVQGSACHQGCELSELEQPQVAASYCRADTRVIEANSLTTRIEDPRDIGGGLPHAREIRSGHRYCSPLSRRLQRCDGASRPRAENRLGYLGSTGIESPRRRQRDPKVVQGKVREDPVSLRVDIVVLEDHWP